MQWNNAAFDRLILPEGQKELILAFTHRPENEEGDFDDFIKGKGLYSFRIEIATTAHIKQAKVSLRSFVVLQEWVKP